MGYFIIAVWTLICTIFGAYSHESDLVRHCTEENTMHLWHENVQVYCEVKKDNANL